MVELTTLHGMRSRTVTHVCVGGKMNRLLLGTEPFTGLSFVISALYKRYAVGLLSGALLVLCGCTDNEVKALDELANGPKEREMSGKVLAAMPANQIAMLASFKAACESYKNQPNEIKKSEVYRGTAEIYQKVGNIKDWVGVLRTISTNQGGASAILIISFASSVIKDEDVVFGSAVYKSASEMSEDQPVVFSGRWLEDYNVTEQGKVCDPNFLISLTDLAVLR